MFTNGKFDKKIRHNPHVSKKKCVSLCVFVIKTFTSNYNC